MLKQQSKVRDSELNLLKTISLFGSQDINKIYVFELNEGVFKENPELTI